MNSHRPNVERFAVRQKDLETEFDRLSRLGKVFMTLHVYDSTSLDFKAFDFILLFPRSLSCPIGVIIAEERRRALEDTVHLFEYMRESADLEQWINEQLQTAMSEEYGDDYEHFKVHLQH